MIAGFIWPVCTGMLSNAAPLGIQGKVMGLSQSMLSLAMLFASIIGGLFLHAHPAVPFLLSALSALIAALLVLITPFKIRLTQPLMGFQWNWLVWPNTFYSTTHKPSFNSS